MYRPSHMKKLKEIADKHGISLATALEISKSQWMFITEHLRGADPIAEKYPVVGIEYLGKFVVTARRKWALKNLHNRYNPKNKEK